MYHHPPRRDRHVPEPDDAVIPPALPIQFPKYSDLPKRREGEAVAALVVGQAPLQGDDVAGNTVHGAVDDAVCPLADAIDLAVPGRHVVARTVHGRVHVGGGVGGGGPGVGGRGRRPRRPGPPPPGGRPAAIGRRRRRRRRWRGRRRRRRLRRRWR